MKIRKITLPGCIEQMVLSRRAVRHPVNSLLKMALHAGMGVGSQPTVTCDPENIHYNLFPHVGAL